MHLRLKLCFVLVDIAFSLLSTNQRVKSSPILRKLFSSSDHHQEVVEHVEQGHLDAFVRLASRWARPGGVAPDDIHMVRPVVLDRRHIELEVLACEDDGCVSILVPIDFPTICCDDDDEECFVKNIEALDGEAIAMSHLSFSQSGAMPSSPEDSVWKGREPPTWWVDADKELEPGLTTECRAVTTLLNDDDFMQERRALTRHGVPGLTPAAAVRCVRACPSGLLFHVCTMKAPSTPPPPPPCMQEKTNSCEIEAFCSDVDADVEVVLLRFPSIVTSISELRSAVLGAVAAATAAESA
mmetsp:Transcript_49894/g.98577  ORF Transcript_49894/g.98577 Transcript_49894/m.98577 type:complete len:297 (-) Transcript_49894:238-1128(-)